MSGQIDVQTTYGRVSSVERLDLDTFVNHSGETFSVSLTGGEPLPLTLDSAVAAQERRPDGRPFSLTFRGPATPRLPQATYRIEHADIGDFDIFLVPVGFAPDGSILYEAVFN